MPDYATDYAAILRQSPRLAPAEEKLRGARKSETLRAGVISAASCLCWRVLA